jgi:hypothetical protein
MLVVQGSKRRFLSLIHRTGHPLLTAPTGIRFGCSPGVNGVTRHVACWWLHRESAVLDELGESVRLPAVPALIHLRRFREASGTESITVSARCSPGWKYITSLANGGAKVTQSFAVTHRGEPNYLALFSGSAHGHHRRLVPAHVHQRRSNVSALL